MQGQPSSRVSVIPKEQMDEVKEKFKKRMEKEGVDLQALAASGFDANSGSNAIGKYNAMKLLLETLQQTKTEVIYERLLGTGEKNDLSFEEIGESFHSILRDNKWDLYKEDKTETNKSGVTNKENDTMSIPLHMLDRMVETTEQDEELFNRLKELLKTHKMSDDILLPNIEGEQAIEELMIYKEKKCLNG